MKVRFQRNAQAKFLSAALNLSKEARFVLEQQQQQRAEC
jgi:hypothetical protein